MEMPGGKMANRPLHFFWIVDISGSMSVDAKIQQLNNAIKTTIPEMQKAASENPNAQVYVRVVAISTTAHWHIANPTPIESFKWENLSADGETAMGHALTLVAEQLRTPPMPERSLPPVIVLITDGEPTDDFENGLKMLFDEPWGKRAIRVGIAIGKDARKDKIKKFINNLEIPVLEANNPQDLVRHIKWVSTQPLKIASNPHQGNQENPNNPMINLNNNIGNANGVDDVW
jgi:uncharacterized protein YegL